MNAHDQLERQLRTGVAGRCVRRFRWIPSLPDLAVGLAVAASVAIAVVLVLTLRHNPRSPTAATGPVARTATIGPAPEEPGPVPKHVDHRLILQAFNQVWTSDAGCSPRGAVASRAPTQATPGAALLAKVPALTDRFSGIHQLPSGFFFVTGGYGAIGPGHAYIRYIRLAESLGGTRFFLVPKRGVGPVALTPALAERCELLELADLGPQLSGLPASERAATRRYATQVFAAARYRLETRHGSTGVGLLALDRKGDAGYSFASLAQIDRGGTISGGGPTGLLAGIVPAGVAKVRLEFPATSYGGRRLSVARASTVVNDVYVIPAPSTAHDGWPDSAVWLSPSGSVIRRINERPFVP